MQLFSNLNRVISSTNRISSVDIWRGVAIIGVVLYHFNGIFPYGSLGVDLFFVISGLLVGALLTQPFLKGESIKFFQFFLRRGFKIWPSYYVFLIVGNLVAILTYNAQYESQIIPLNDMLRYLFFYQNYTGEPYHWSFDHVWSLCIEEHFYLLFPLMLMVLGLFRKNWSILFVSLLIVIALGFVAKVLMLYYSTGQDTYAATHNRIDALAWGVLLNILIYRFSSRIKSFNHPYVISLIGIAGLGLAVAIDHYWDFIFYEKVVMHSITPLFFFMMILGTYYLDFSKWKVLRITGYYSYNWYLWHPILVIITTQYLGAGIGSFIVYILSSFLIAVLFTFVVEEPMLKLRRRILPK